MKPVQREPGSALVFYRGQRGSYFFEVIQTPLSEGQTPYLWSYWTPERGPNNPARILNLLAESPRTWFKVPDIATKLHLAEANVATILDALYSWQARKVLARRGRDSIRPRDYEIEYRITIRAVESKNLDELVI